MKTITALVGVNMARVDVSVTALQGRKGQGELGCLGWS